MSRRRWPWLPSTLGGTLATLALISAPSVAHAYLLLSKGTKTSAAGTSVVIVREGEHDVVSLRFRVKDKGDKVLVVVPVPASVMEHQASTGGPFAAVANVVSPRVEELWEQDPCELHGMEPPPIGPSSLPDAAPPAKKKPKPVPKAPAEGNYEISVLEGKGAEMVAALKAKGVTLSSDVEPLIVAYGDVGMKLVVAEIATSELDGNELPPLMIHSQAKELTLPTRLHAAGKAGPLDVFVLSPHMRFEAKNQKNQAIPTNLDVKVPAAKNPGGFYSALVARTFADAPDAVITEYAWRALDCEGCTAPLDAAAISRLGVGLLPSASTGGQQEVIVDAAGVSGEPGGPDEMRKALTACYGKTLASTPGLGASVTLDVVVKDEAVQSVKARGTGPEALVACATEAAKAADLDESGALTITFSPTSRKFFADMVLTKLRVQQAAVPDKDLLLGAGRAIEGGRENGPEGKPEKKVYWAEATNNFQPRYVLRHAWKGAVKCLSPQRGSWTITPPKGEKPAGKGGGAMPALETVIEGGLPEITAYAIASSKPVQAPSVPSGPNDAPAPEASAAPSPSAPASSPPPRDAGCGCRVAPARGGDAWWSGVLALGWLGRRLRLRSRRLSASGR